jgi:CrcB protein
VKGFVLVALGGAIGSVARYLLSAWTLHHTLGWRFPLGTFLVNVIGSLAVGVLGGLVVKHDVFSAETRVFLFTGLAGGFTTFSAFALETFYLLRRDEVLVAGAYALSSIVVSLLVLWLGFVAVTPRTS